MSRTISYFFICMLQYSATRWFYARYICVHAIVDYFYTKDSNTRFLGVCALYTLARYCGENTVIVYACVGMYICVCIFMYRYIYVCICMYMYVYANICMHMYVYVRACICVYLHVSVCMCLYVYVYVSICMYTYVDVCICMCVDVLYIGVNPGGLGVVTPRFWAGGRRGVVDGL